MNINSQHNIFDKFSNETNAKIKAARVNMYTCAIIEMMNARCKGFCCAIYGKGSRLKILVDRAYHCSTHHLCVAYRAVTHVISLHVALAV